MSQYYGIERSSEYLSHYGIRGMKWGVRRAIARGDRAALSRNYMKASKKLAKLSSNANREVQRKRFEQAKKNMAAGAGISAGISAGGTAAMNGHLPAGERAKIAALAGLGGAVGGALLNSQGIMSGRHISDKGHARAIRKRDEFAKEMNQIFKGTGITSNRKMKRFHNDNKKGFKVYTGATSRYMDSQSSGKRVITGEQARGLANLADKFDGHYKQGLSQGMTKKQAESYANKKMSTSSKKNQSALKKKALDATARMDQAYDNLSFLGKHGFGKTAKAYKQAHIESKNATADYYNSLTKKQYARLRKRHVG